METVVCWGDYKEDVNRFVCLIRDKSLAENWLADRVIFFHPILPQDCGCIACEQYKAPPVLIENVSKKYLIAV